VLTDYLHRRILIPITPPIHECIPPTREGNQQINCMCWKPLSVWKLAPIETVGRNIQFRWLVLKKRAIPRLHYDDVQCGTCGRGFRFRFLKKQDCFTRFGIVDGSVSVNSFFSFLNNAASRQTTTRTPIPTMKSTRARSMATLPRAARPSPSTNSRSLNIVTEAEMDWMAQEDLDEAEKEFLPTGTDGGPVGKTPRPSKEDIRPSIGSEDEDEIEAEGDERSGNQGKEATLTTTMTPRNVERRCVYVHDRKYDAKTTKSKSPYNSLKLGGSIN
jgi:hypothetical protein